MNSLAYQFMVKGWRLGLAILGGFLLLLAVLFAINMNTFEVHADPIIPEEGGYPKFNTSIKMVTPTLAHTGGVTLYYTIEIRNTGAWEALTTTLIDVLPEQVTYLYDLDANVPFSLDVEAGTLTTLTWQGNVGFDSTAVVTFSVRVDEFYSGEVPNTAVISHPLMTRPVTVTAETVVTNYPILTIEKSSEPALPGANKPLTYTLAVANVGQPATDLLVTVVDQVPFNTTLRDIGIDGSTNAARDVVTWTRYITLDLGETTYFSFSVDVGSVLSGTVITNDDYQVDSPVTEVETGEPYTVTVVDPIFYLFKEVWPDPPGSNREMTYTLSVLNVGSLATELVITDVVPAGVDDQGGAYSSTGEIVSWAYPSLDTGELAEFTFTVYISDVMDLPIVNRDYSVCSAEGICQTGDVLTSVVQGPNFEAFAFHDPIAKKPGGGGGPVTPTLTVRNLGPGNALDAMAILFFDRVSVSEGDLLAIPEIGTAPSFPDGPECGEKCKSYIWEGDLGVGEMITFTTHEGQSTIGGEEGTFYTSTVVITDSLVNMPTEPITATAIGRITHLAYLIPTKSAPPVVGPGQLMTYTIGVWNSALTTDEPPPPWLTDTVPLSTTVVHISDGGVSGTLTGTAQTVVSWTLPALGTGERLQRSFVVRTDDDLISGTQIVNADYRVSWYEDDATYTGVVSNTGQSVTTTVREVGLIDSYKEVTPTVISPGPGTVLTYYLHIVNSSGIPLTDVTAYDLLPWEASTYQRDAVASAGQVVSDIVSFRWTGNVAAFSSEVVTVTVLIDEDFEGPITNTAVISHSDLPREVGVGAVAYVTDEPVLKITKRASPDPVERGEQLTYEITVVNLGQRATNLLITDTIPANTTYVSGGRLVDEQVQWESGELLSSTSNTFVFQVIVDGGSEIINERYGVTCGEGVIAMGEPVSTTVAGGGGSVYLPLVLR